MTTNLPMIPPQVWRQQGAPESVATVSQSFLAKLAEKLGLKSDPARTAAENVRGEASQSIVTKTEDYDCRIGEKAKKRRREAQKVVKVTAQTDKRKKRKVAELNVVSNTKRPKARPEKDPDWETSALASLPLGWEAEWKDESLNFVSLDGERFDGLKKAQEYCKQRHFPKQPAAKKKGAEETQEEVTLPALSAWLRAGGRAGAVSGQRGLAVAAARARQKIRAG